MTTGKTIALTIKTFVGKVMSLLFNTLSRFVIAFLLRSMCLLISWLQSLLTVILEPKKINLSLFPMFLLLFAMKWWDLMPRSSFFEFWVLSQIFHSSLSPSSRSCLDPLCFLPLGQCHPHIGGYWYFCRQSVRYYACNNLLQQQWEINRGHKSSLCLFLVIKQSVY